MVVLCGTKARKFMSGGAEAEEIQRLVLEFSKDWAPEQSDPT
jgi:hypothetical protein